MPSATPRTKSAVKAHSASTRAAKRTGHNVTPSYCFCSLSELSRWERPLAGMYARPHCFVRHQAFCCFSVADLAQLSSSWVNANEEMTLKHAIMHRLDLPKVVSAQPAGVRYIREGLVQRQGWKVLVRASLMALNVSETYLL